MFKDVYINHITIFENVPLAGEHDRLDIAILFFLRQIYCYRIFGSQLTKKIVQIASNIKYN